MKSKTVLITGTSKGIGLETALAFGRAGYQVFATMRNPERSPELAERAKKESLPISISVLDVNSDESVRKCFEAVHKEVGALDVLVNNAGIERHGSIEETKISEFKEVMETNYFGALRCIQAVLPAMRGKKSGCIINVTSVAGILSNTPLGPYCASKWALEAAGESLAQEVKPFNIRVANVEPGIIDTEMAHNIDENGKKSIYPQVNRFGGLFEASLRTPTPSTLVADKILEIADNGTWQLRHPVGPDAAPFLQWRASMSDLEWTDWNAVDDEAWYKAVADSFGLDARRVN